MHAKNHNVTKNTRPLFLSVDQTAELFGVSPALVRLEIHRGHLRATRIGKRLLVPYSEIEQRAQQGDRAR